MVKFSDIKPASLNQKGLQYNGHKFSVTVNRAMSFQFSEIMFFLTPPETVAHANEVNIANKDSPKYG